MLGTNIPLCGPPDLNPLSGFDVKFWITRRCQFVCLFVCVCVTKHTDARAKNKDVISARMCTYMGYTRQHPNPLLPKATWGWRSSSLHEAFRAATNCGAHVRVHAGDRPSRLSASFSMLCCLPVAAELCCSSLHLLFPSFLSLSLPFYSCLPSSSSSFVSHQPSCSPCMPRSCTSC